MTAEPRSNNVGLGRGLAALIPQREEQSATVELPIAAISRNPYQPRQAVDQAQLEALAEKMPKCEYRDYIDKEVIAEAKRLAARNT